MEGDTLRSSRWRRLAQQAAAAPPSAPGERCELCSAPLEEAHRHLFDVRADELRCACQACSLLFDRREAGGGHYRAVPRRRLRLSGLELDDLTWGGLEIPVDLAFFVVDDSGAVTATYPNPLGLVRSSPDAGLWGEVVNANSVLAGMEPGVEALLVYRRSRGHQYWLVPVDVCYRLASVVRAHWEGFTGGDGVWREIDAFFEGLARGSRTVDRSGAAAGSARPDKEVQWSPG